MTLEKGFHLISLYLVNAYFIGVCGVFAFGLSESNIVIFGKYGLKVGVVESKWKFDFYSMWCVHT